MPKAPRAAQITIVVLAVLAVVYGASIIHLSEDTGGTRRAATGQLVVVRMNSSWTSLESSDTTVVAPISINLRPITTGYFVALKPGKATLRAIDNPCSSYKAEACIFPVRGWSAEIEVWPGQVNG